MSVMCAGVGPAASLLAAWHASSFDPSTIPPIVERIGWTLVHFTWEGLAVAALLWVTLRTMRDESSTSSARYGVCCLAMALLVALPVVTFCFVRATPVAWVDTEALTRRALQAAEAAERAGLTAEDVSSFAASPSQPHHFPLLPPLERLRTLFPWLVGAWAIGVAMLGLWHAVGWLRVRRLSRAHVTPMGALWEASLRDLARRLGVRRAVRLLESTRATVPMVIGWLRPVILIPASAVSGLSVSQLEAILAHELAHVRRLDYLVNLIQVAAETLLFYHPAVWWVSGRIRTEREHCCDDLAAAATPGGAIAYARALAKLEELRMPTMPHDPLRLVPAATTGSLLSRVRRLLGTPEEARNADTATSHRSRPIAAAVLVAAAIAAGAIAPFAGLPGAVAADSQAPAPASDIPKDRPLQAEDVIRVNVVDPAKPADQPKKLTTARIDAKGNIQLPHVGRMQAAGLTATKLQEQIKRSYGPEGVNMSILAPNEQYTVTFAPPGESPDADPAQETKSADLTIDGVRLADVTELAGEQNAIANVTTQLKADLVELQAQGDVTVAQADAEDVKRQIESRIAVVTEDGDELIVEANPEFEAKLDVSADDKTGVATHPKLDEFKLDVAKPRAAEIETKLDFVNPDVEPKIETRLDFVKPDFDPQPKVETKFDFVEGKPDVISADKVRIEVKDADGKPQVASADNVRVEVKNVDGKITAVSVDQSPDAPAEKSAPVKARLNKKNPDGKSEPGEMPDKTEEPEKPEKLDGSADGLKPKGEAFNKVQYLDRLFSKDGKPEAAEKAARDAQVQVIRKQLEQTASQLVEVRKQLGDQHPQVMALQGQQDQLKLALRELTAANDKQKEKDKNKKEAARVFIARSASADLANRAAAADVARQRLSAEEQKVSRLKLLYDKGNASEAELDRARAQLDKANAELDKAKAEFERSRRGQNDPFAIPGNNKNFNRGPDGRDQADFERDLARRKLEVLNEELARSEVERAKAEAQAQQKATRDQAEAQLKALEMERRQLLDAYEEQKKVAADMEKHRADLMRERDAMMKKMEEERRDMMARQEAVARQAQEQARRAEADAERARAQAMEKEANAKAREKEVASGEYFISGVPQAGSRPVRTGGRQITLLQALVAGGFDPAKNHGSEIVIVRQPGDPSSAAQRETVSVDDAIDGKQRPLQSGDVILVRPGHGDDGGDRDRDGGRRR